MGFIRKFLKINKIILPVLFFLVFFVFLRQKTAFSSIILIIFAIWSILDGMLSLKHLDFVAYTKSIEEFNLAAEEKEKRKKWSLNLTKFFSICKIIGPIAFLWFWFILLKAPK